jgi:hypothetical protein
MTTWRNCKTCETKRPIEDFYKHSQYKDGRMSWCKFCHSDKVKAKYNPLVRKARKLKYNYGITLDEYNSKLKEQDNLCAICKSDKPGGNGDFYVDHNHATGQVRGLLCHWCNFMIGQCKEDPEILSAGIDYLKKWSQS